MRLSSSQGGNVKNRTSGLKVRPPWVWWFAFIVIAGRLPIGGVRPVFATSGDHGVDVWGAGGGLEPGGRISWPGIVRACGVRWRGGLHHIAAATGFPREPLVRTSSWRACVRRVGVHYRQADFTANRPLLRHGHDRLAEIGRANV